MKAILLTAIAVCLCFAGCATTGADVPQTAAQIQLQITKACAVAQPTLASVVAMSPQATPDQKASVLDKLSGDVTLACTANASVNTASLNELVQTAIPAAIQFIANTSLSASDKTAIQIGLIAFQTALSAALVQYSAPAAPVLSASGVIVA